MRQLSRLDPLHAPKGTVEPGEKRTADHCQERQRNHRLQEREAFLPRRHQRIVPARREGAEAAAYVSRAHDGPATFRPGKLRLPCNISAAEQ